MEYIVFIGIFVFIQIFLMILLKPNRFKYWQWGGIQFLVTYLFCFTILTLLVGQEGEGGMILFPFIIPIGLILMVVSTNLWFAGLTNSLFYILVGVVIGAVFDYLKI